MFIWDFVLGTVMDQIIEWLYGQVVGFLADFCTNGKHGCGVVLHGMGTVHRIVFSYLAWALYGTGLVVSVFETGIEYQHGRGSIKDTALNALKGFMAVSLYNPAGGAVRCRLISRAASRRNHRIWHQLQRPRRKHYCRVSRFAGHRRRHGFRYLWRDIRYYKPYHDALYDYHDGICRD